MHRSYRALRLAVGAGLLGLSHLGAAQTAPTADDSIKGRLWTATAQRIWADTKPKQPQPAPWPTVQAFEKWLVANPADKSELGLLRADVVRGFGAGTKATPTQVAQAIVGQVAQRQQSGQGRLARVKAPLLGADLAPLTQASAPANAPNSNPSPTTGTTTVTAVPGAGGVTALPANPDSINNQDIKPLSSNSGFIATPAEPRYFGLSPTLAGLSLLLLGGLVGSLVASQLKSKRRARRPYRSSAPLVEPDSSSIMNSPEYRKLYKQNQTLSAQLQKLQKQVAELQKQLSPAPATAAKTPPPPVSSPAKTPPPAVPVAVPELSIEELVGAEPETTPAPPLPPATRYGPVQETPFVEERKLVDMPLPQLALMITVNPHNSSQAIFTLNPQVDQARLIGDGLKRLQKFFDHDPPIGNRITMITASQPGQLQRHADGWQVVQRARLTIS